MARNLRIILAAVALIVAVAGLTAGNASAAQFHGACGGGDTLNGAIAGWKAHGVLDDVARMTGQTPGVDGSAEHIVKTGMVKTTVVKGGYVRNFTCTGGKFSDLHKKKYIPAGAIYWVAERYAPKCNKKHGSAQKKVKQGMQGNCGNKQEGSLLVKRKCPKPKHKKPKKPVKKPCGCTPPPASCPAGTVAVAIGGGIACQSNQQTIGSGSCNGSNNSSNTTGNGNVTGDCNQVNQNCVGNNVCNTTTNPPPSCTCPQTCSPCPPPPPPPTCPAGQTGTPPNCTTPSSPAPTLTLTQVNDVEVGQTRPYTVDYTVPSGHSATLTFDAHYGAFSATGTGAVSFTVSGSGSQTATYTAPGEVPPGGTDTITVTITDTTTGQSVSKTTDPFTIKPTAVHPG